MAYDFHYTPTGTGVISGKEVLEQTEDAINDLGNTAISGVQEALDKAEQALTNSENAVDDAQTALNTANNAEGVAIQAQNDVSNLSGTVTNIGNRVTTAEGNIGNLQGRMTTAEGNIGNLQGRMTTAEGNIGNLQTAVSTAQATANSAQQTATTARGQAYVVRYASVAVSDNSTVPYTDLNNTDNIKANDLLLDINGKFYQITSVDTSNETVSVTTPLTQLAVDSEVVHINGNENINDDKNFTGLLTTLVNGTLWPVVNRTTDDITLLSANAVHVEQRGSGNLTDLSGGAWNIAELGNAAFFFRNNSGVDIRYKHFPTNLVNRIYVVNGANRHINDLIPDQDNTRDVGSNSLRWATFNGINPGALSFPDLDNGIDISGYLTPGNSNNTYTPLVDGYVSVNIGIASGGCAVFLSQGDLYNACYSATGAPDVTGVSAWCMLPVKGGVQMNIGLKGGNNYINSAKFYPCQGNV